MSCSLIFPLFSFEPRLTFASAQFHTVDKVIWQHLLHRHIPMHGCLPFWRSSLPKALVQCDRVDESRAGKGCQSRDLDVYRCQQREMFRGHVDHHMSMERRAVPRRLDSAGTCPPARIPAEKVRHSTWRRNGLHDGLDDGNTHREGELWVRKQV